MRAFFRHVVSHIDRARCRIFVEAVVQWQADRVSASPLVHAMLNAIGTCKVFTNNVIALLEATLYHYFRLYGMFRAGHLPISPTELLVIAQLVRCRSDSDRYPESLQRQLDAHRRPTRAQFAGHRGHRSGAAASSADAARVHRVQAAGAVECGRTADAAAEVASDPGELQNVVSIDVIFVCAAIYVDIILGKRTAISRFLTF